MIITRNKQAPVLWSALVRARAEETPRTFAHIQDVVFRLYLPLARSRARETAPQVAGHVDAAGAAVDQAAEMGLAQAVLCWPYSHGRGFETFALEMIDSRLRSLNPSTSSGNAGMFRHPPEITSTAARLHAVPPSPAIGKPGLGTHRGALPPAVGVPDRSLAPPVEHLVCQ